MGQKADMGQGKTRPEADAGAPDIERAILLGATAGACRLWAREDPAIAPGMTKAAESYSEQSAEILTKWADGQ